MSEFKGTPGPWLMDGRTLYSLQDSDSRFVDKENRFSAGFFGYKNCPESEVLANVTLCTAAPELLKELQLLVACVIDLENYYGFSADVIVEDAQAAIAKALGETK